VAILREPGERAQSAYSWFQRGFETPGWHPDRTLSRLEWFHALWEDRKRDNLWAGELRPQWTFLPAGCELLYEMPPTLRRANASGPHEPLTSAELRLLKDIYLADFDLWEKQPGIL
jgi:hypothetical protein